MESNESKRVSAGTTEPREVASPQSLPTKSGLAWAVRLEIWTLLCAHGAILVLAGVSHTVTLYFGLLLGWLPAGSTPAECALLSPLGFVLAAGPFLLVATVLSGLAWRLHRLARGWAGTAAGESGASASPMPPAQST